MQRRISLYGMILFMMVFTSGCYLNIEQLIQSMQVCVGDPFNATLQTTAVVEDSDDYFNGSFSTNSTVVGSAVLLPIGWQIISCDISGDIFGDCIPDEEVAFAADSNFPSSERQTWYGCSLFVPGGVNNNSTYQFNWTIRPTTRGSFTLTYFSALGTEVSDGNGTSIMDWSSAEDWAGLVSVNGTSYASRRTVADLCDEPAPVPALSGWGTGILLIVFLAAGAGIMAMKRRRSKASAALVVLAAALLLLGAFSLAEAARKPSLNMDSAAALCEELRVNDDLRAQLFADIKGFIRSYFELTPKEEQILQGLSDADLENALMEVMNSDKDCVEVLILQKKVLGGVQVSP